MHGLRIIPLLFADDVALVASSNCDLQLSMKQQDEDQCLQKLRSYIELISHQETKKKTLKNNIFQDQGCLKNNTGLFKQPEIKSLAFACVKNVI